MVTRLRFLAAGALAAALAACNLAPLHEVPALAPTAAAAFKQSLGAAEQAGWKVATPGDGAAIAAWWRIFDDPQLDTLMQQALAANPTVEASHARLVRSRALLGSAQADRLPRIDGGAGITRSRPSPAALGLPAGSEVAPATLWRAQIGASWEPDLFGRVANRVAAAEADAQRSAALHRGLVLAVQADVAHHLFTLRGLDTERALLDETVQLREATLSLVERRHRAGEISELDVARARTELSVTRTEAIALARRRAEVEHALAVLLGRAPVELDVPRTPLRFQPVAIPAGLPSALLERRPDIAAAERAMAEANAAIGLARAAFYPSFTLTGSVGVESSSAGDLFRAASRTWALGPIVGTMLTVPLFDGGRNRANLAAAQARHEATAAEYRQTVLQAIREVEDALAATRLLAEQAREQAQSSAAARRAAQISASRYRSGLVNQLELIDAERSVLATERAAAQVERERALAAVALVRSLGGGWAASGPAAAADADRPVSLTMRAR